MSYKLRGVIASQTTELDGYSTLAKPGGRPVTRTTITLDDQQGEICFDARVGTVGQAVTVTVDLDDEGAP